MADSKENYVCDLKGLIEGELWEKSVNERKS